MLLNELFFACLATSMLFDRSDIPECIKYVDSMKALRDLFNNGLPQMKKNAFLCLPSCQKTSFDHQMNNIKMNQFSGTFGQSEDFELDSFCVKMSYDTLQTEVKTETYVFDLSSFLSAAGGNLGLALGFSCLTVLNQCFLYFFHFVQHLCDK